MDRLGCLPVLALPFALWLSVVMPGNHLVNQTFWPRVGDVLVATVVMMVLSSFIQSSYVPLVASARLEASSTLGLQVLFFAVAVFLYFLTTKSAGYLKAGIISDGLPGALLGGAVVAVAVLAGWFGMAVRRVDADIREINRPTRFDHDDDY